MLGTETAPSSPMLSAPYRAIPGELVRSSGTDVTLDGILSIIDEHYKNIMALDALNQELFQLQMGEKEMDVRVEGVPVEAPPISHGPIPRMLCT